MSENATPRSVEQGMARLKELLFDSEVETLGELDKRLNSIEAMHNRQAREQLEVLRRMEQLFERAGSEERFKTSVAVVLDKALAEAELRNHDEMSRAMAPLVINTIKTELRNSQDELVEIMYPITGRMVRAFVAAEMKRLSESVNNSIDRNPVMLRLRSLVTGRPMADLAIAESQRLVVTEVFLIRRGSGELLAHWPPSQAMSNADVHMSGLLSAINDMAASAFGAEGGSFRSFDYEGFNVHMRASPVYLLAAKCTGIAPSGTSAVIDEAFLETFERISEFEKSSGQAGATMLAVPARSRELEPLADSVRVKTTKIYDDIARTSIGSAVVKFLLFVIAVPLLAWFFWGLYTDAEEGIVRRSAQSVIASTPQLKGYQTNLDVGYRGKTITLTGLLPDGETQNQLITTLQRELPTTEIKTSFGVLPKPEVAPVVQFDTSAVEERLRQRVAAAKTGLIADVVRRSVDRAEARLGEALPLLDRLLERDGNDVRVQQQVGAARDTLRGRREALRKIAQSIEVAAREGARGELENLTLPLSTASAEIHQAIGKVVVAYGGEALGAPPVKAVESAAAAEEVLAQAERVATLALALQRPVRIDPQQPVAPALSPDDQLRRFIDNHAIFFSTGTEFRSVGLAVEVLDEAARLIKVASRLVRVVGYTDERGSEVQNREIAQQRAATVVDELVRRGVPAERLVGIGRLDGSLLNPESGQSNPNRRVQFELGFRGETRSDQ